MGMIEPIRFNFAGMTTDELFAACQAQRRLIAEARREHAQLAGAAALRITVVVALLAAVCVAVFVVATAFVSTDAALLGAGVSVLVAAWRLERQLQAAAAAWRRVRRARAAVAMHRDTLAAAERRMLAVNA